MMSIFGLIKQKILALLFANEDKDFYIREIAGIIGASPMGAQKALIKLEQDGIVVSQMRGLQKFYSLNKKYPAYDELKGLTIKTFGVAGVLKDALDKIMGIDEAFVYGSFAKGEMDSSSDIDLFVIGDVDYNALSKAASRAQDILGREVNFDLFSEKEILKKKKEMNAYLEDVIHGQRIQLIKDGKRI